MKKIILKGKINLDLKENSEVKYFAREELSDLDIAFNHKELLNEFFNDELKIIVK